MAVEMISGQIFVYIELRSTPIHFPFETINQLLRIQQLKRK